MARTSFGSSGSMVKAKVSRTDDIQTGRSLPFSRICPLGPGWSTRVMPQ